MGKNRREKGTSALVTGRAQLRGQSNHRGTAGVARRIDDAWIRMDRNGDVSSCSFDLFFSADSVQRAVDSSVRYEAGCSDSRKVRERVNER